VQRFIVELFSRRFSYYREKPSRKGNTKKEADMLTGLAQARVWMSVLLVLICILVAPRVNAQGVATSFEKLPILLKPGDAIQVTDAQGHKTTGKLAELTTSSLELQVRKAGFLGRASRSATSERSRLRGTTRC
jgi:hypothetical protein